MGLFVFYEPLVAAKAKERQATSTGGANPQLRENSHEAEKGRTDESLAQIAGVSSQTIRRTKVVKELGGGFQVTHHKPFFVFSATRRTRPPPPVIRISPRGGQKEGL